MPHGASDCHAHVFGPQSQYALLPDTHFVPHVTPWTVYAEMLRSIGCQRAVLVQPSVYGYENAAIEDAMAQAEDIELRGVAVVAPDVSEAELLRLHRLGFRGIRINTASRTQGLQLKDAMHLAGLIGPLGWYLEFFSDFHADPGLEDTLASLPVPICIDHFGRVRAEEGVDSPSFKAVLRLLGRENCWAKLSAPYFASNDFPEYGNLAPLVQAMLAVAPDRLLWGTDWPHASAREKLPVDAELVDMLGRWVPDEVARRRILVDNPKRLYGFSEA